MAALDECYGFREQLVERLERDLFGPSRPDETLVDFPLERYIVGVLYPRTADEVDPSQDDDTSDGDDETPSAAPPVATASARNPSSAGMTFAVDLDRASAIT